MVGVISDRWEATDKVLPDVREQQAQWLTNYYIVHTSMDILVQKQIRDKNLIYDFLASITALSTKLSRDSWQNNTELRVLARFTAKITLRQSVKSCWSNTTV